MYDASKFTSFFPMGISTGEWHSFVDSLVPQVMLFWEQADEVTLRALRALVRKRTGRIDAPVRIILRLPRATALRLGEGDLHDEFRLMQKWAGGNITTIIFWNEPDQGVSLRWHGPRGESVNWGNRLPNQQVQQFVAELWPFVNALSDLGVTLVSPAYTSRGYTEDDAPDPGLQTWRGFTEGLYYGPGSAISGNGVHYYDGGWWQHDPFIPAGMLTPGACLSYAEALAQARVVTSTNVNRFMNAVRFYSGFHHHELYWDESNTLNSSMTPAQHMEACVGKSKLLIHHVNPEGYRLGERVALYAPFANNGDANGWPAQYVMNTPECYGIVRAHMVEEGYYA